MLTPKLPTGQSSLEVLPQKVRIVLDEGSEQPLAFVSQPVEDIAEIEELRASNFSLEEHADKRFIDSINGFSGDFDSLHSKFDRFSSSPVYLHRLATLAEYSGANDSRNYRRRAFELASSPFYAHQLGDSIASVDGFDAAEEFFSALSLDRDIGVILRLAAFAVRRGDFLRAEKFIRAGLEIDPIDFSTRLFDGGLNLLRSEYQSAIQSFRIALRERPTSSSAHYNLAVAYLGIREEKKALSSLRRAVALDPLSPSAVCLLSDVAFSLKRDDEAVPSLRYFVQFEQKNEGVWSRLARACYKIGKPDESIAALKHQASIRDSSGVWNNLGVSYLKINKADKGLEAFVHAMRIGESSRNRDYFLAARNAVCLLSERSAYEKLGDLVSRIVKADDYGWLVADEEISDIFPFYINSLYQLGRRNDAAKLAHEVLSSEGICDTLALWLVGSLVGYQALSGHDPKSVADFIDNNESRFSSISSEVKGKNSTYFNNVAFALADMGRIEDAINYLQPIMHLVHKSAYPTATFGLIQFRKGRSERAINLYEEAISLAQSKKDKTRIRQKMSLELARNLLRDENPARARRILERVASERHGEDALSKQAAKILRELVKFKG